MTDDTEDRPRDEAGAAPEAGETAPEARIAALEAELAETRDRLLRLAAEMDNLRKRTQREKEDAARFAISRFARDIVTVSDDLARALAAVPESARAEGGELANLVAGIELTDRQLQQVFARHGVTRFDPEGEKFDPTVHEAMFQVPDPSKPAGIVAHVVEPGYMIGDRVLRPARVGVSAGGPQAATPQHAGSKPAGAAPSPAAEAAEPEAGRETGPERIGLKIDRSA